MENFHRCREEQEKEERVRRAAKRALQMEKRRRSKYTKLEVLLNTYNTRNCFVSNEPPCILD